MAVVLAKSLKTALQLDSTLFSAAAIQRKPASSAGSGAATKEPEDWQRDVRDVPRP